MDNGNNVIRKVMTVILMLSIIFVTVMMLTIIKDFSLFVHIFPEKDLDVL